LFHRFGAGSDLQCILGDFFGYDRQTICFVYFCLTISCQIPPSVSTSTTIYTTR
jgi:hypothetical protein